METESEDIRQERIRRTLEKHKSGQDSENIPPNKTATGQKICPFSCKPCNPDCKLYRKEKEGYECYLQELQSVTWLMTEIKKLLQKLTK
jgi:hypothetical protein